MRRKDRSRLPHKCGTDDPPLMYDGIQRHVKGEWDANASRPVENIDVWGLGEEGVIRGVG